LAIEELHRFYRLAVVHALAEPSAVARLRVDREARVVLREVVPQAVIEAAIARQIISAGTLGAVRLDAPPLGAREHEEAVACGRNLGSGSRRRAPSARG
jgi:hypothetical protein